ncbi:hypothetical protein SAPIO_CDS1041 [Scedosporium apiospermum]|uniref:Involucrin repeat protein n=1 Tax=Pseudallescheria apiosperma TaxID=563466 RepID=A0A084GFQ6_PSEDA|nr:uncharacterized protein SAPIO_CDS1041 [Scedosporium apiospermum]KEZ46168.1 hypothetical protein SAPIO_CDS1041 [Scedosporium apiospermum]
MRLSDVSVSLQGMMSLTPFSETPPTSPNAPNFPAALQRLMPWNLPSPPTPQRERDQARTKLAAGHPGIHDDLDSFSSSTSNYNHSTRHTKTAAPTRKSPNPHRGPNKSNRRPNWLYPDQKQQEDQAPLLDQAHPPPVLARSGPSILPSNTSRRAPHSSHPTTHSEASPASFPRPRSHGYGRTHIAEGISTLDRDRRRGGAGGGREKEQRAAGMSSSGGGAGTAAAAEKRRSLHVSKTGGSSSGGGSVGGGSRGRSGSVGKGALIAPPPKAFQAGPASSSSSDRAEDGHGHGPEAGSSAGSGKEGNSSSSGSTPTPVTAAAMVAALKEKDEKIAMLQRELSIMETEFAKELDRLSQNESETATFWQNKHSALNQQFLRADTELRLLRAEVEVRRGEREELREGWDILRKQVRERDEEIAGLMAQVRGLKEWVSTSTRSDAQTTDEVFGEGMAKLANSLQNWVIVNFRKAKLDLINASPEMLENLRNLVPMYEELAPVAKVHLLQSVVSGILVDMVFNAYYVGLSKEQTERFRQMEDLLRSFADSDAPINQWRSSTLSILRRDSSKRLATETETLTAAVIARINTTLDALTDDCSTPQRDQTLRSLVQSSVDLARLLAVQKAEFRVWMPGMVAHQRTTFDGRTMEDLGGEEDDEEGLSAREIWCVAFPGVIKRGDESGGHLQFENVIAKARVLCRPEE